MRGQPREQKFDNKLISYYESLNSRANLLFDRFDKMYKKFEQKAHQPPENKIYDFITHIVPNRDVPITLLDENRNFKTAVAAFEYIFSEYGPVSEEVIPEPKLEPYQDFVIDYSELPKDLQDQEVILQQKVTRPMD